MNKRRVLLIASPKSGYYPPFNNLTEAELTIVPYEEDIVSKDLFSAVSISDVLICDISKPSLNLICGLSYASDLEKPVIIMAEESIHELVEKIKLPNNWVGEFSYSMNIRSMSDLDIEHTENADYIGKVLSKIFSPQNDMRQREPRSVQDELVNIAWSSLVNPPQIVTKKFSSAIFRAVGYDVNKHILQIEFNNGVIFQYYGVPEKFAVEIDSANAPDEYFSAHIKNFFPHKRINSKPQQRNKSTKYFDIYAANDLNPHDDAYGVWVDDDHFERYDDD